MKTLFILLLLTNAATTAAQDVNSLVSQQISTIRSGNRPEYKVLDQAISKNPEAVLKALAPYPPDTLERVREWTYEQYCRILLLCEKPLPVRRKIVEKLVEGLSDRQVIIRNDCVDYLTQCSRQDFTPQAQEEFGKRFNSKSWFSKDLILLAGFIGDASCMTTLEELAWSPASGQRRLQWHAGLALSRMGDNNAMSRCLSQIDRIGLNDDVTYELLPGLIYTRQRRMFEYLVTVLNSDEKLCSSSNPDSDVSILCGYRVMEYFAPVIRGYPLKQLPSGDIDTKDYHKALLSARDWFAKRKGEYEILKDTF
jgi:hypothetical protein